MIGIVIVAHGGLAQGYLSALEHVVGHAPGTVAVSIGADDDSVSKGAEIEAAARSVDKGHGVAVVTDIFGSTPSNLAVDACRNTNRTVISGANLPLLIKLSKARHLPLNDAVSTALTAGRKYINCVDGAGMNGSAVPL